MVNNTNQQELHLNTDDYDMQKLFSAIFSDTGRSIPEEKKKFKPNFKVIAGIAIAITIVIFALHLVFGKQTVNLDAYLLEPAYVGSNGNGIVHTNIDSETFVSDYEEIVDYTGKVKSSASGRGADIFFDMILGDSAADSLYSEYIKFHIKLSENSNLSNGDTITYTFDFTEDELKEIEKYFNVKLEYSEGGITYTVHGLE